MTAATATPSAAAATSTGLWSHPSSSNSANQSASMAVPWDEQVVPALRKQLEAESAQLSKHICRMDSDSSRMLRDIAEPQAHRYRAEAESVAPATGTYEYVPSGVSLYGTPSRTALHILKGGSSGGLQHSPSTKNAVAVAAAGAAGRSTDLFEVETERARERARTLRERKKSLTASTNGPPIPEFEASIRMPDDADEGRTDSLQPTRSHPEQQGDVEQPPSARLPTSPRLRTQSTPMQYVSNSTSPSASNPSSPIASKQAAYVAGDSRAHASLSHADWKQDPHGDSKAASHLPSAGPPAQGDPYGSQGPHRLLEPPFSHHKLRYFTDGDSVQGREERRHCDDAISTTTDARPRRSSKLTAGPSYRSLRAVTEPSPHTHGAALWDWEEVLPPAIARRVAQEELLRRDPGLQDVDSLIDTWDKSGLPLTQKSIQAMAEKVTALETKGLRKGTDGDDTHLQSFTAQKRSLDAQSRRARMSQLVEGMALNSTSSGHAASTWQQGRAQMQQEYPPMSRQQASGLKQTPRATQALPTSERTPVGAKRETRGKATEDGATCCSCLVM